MKGLARSFSDKRNTPLKKGNHYWVPHALYKDKWIAVYPYRHNDIKSGQPEFHYHIDFRFEGRDNSIPNRVEYSGKLKYIEKEYSSAHSAPTPSSLIIDSIKQKSLCKGRYCPHKGYDLLQEKPKDGVITCPLHGLKFDYISKKLKCLE